MKNPKYLAWVRKQNCCACDMPADDAHHIIGTGGMSGMGMKAPDWATMPLCRLHHTLVHNYPDMWARQWGWIKKTLDKAEQDGIEVGDLGEIREEIARREVRYQQGFQQTKVGLYRVEAH